MAEKRANALVEFGADDVLELAGVRIGFGFGDRKCVGEQAFGETAAANDVARAIFPVSVSATSLLRSSSRPRSFSRAITVTGSCTSDFRMRSSSGVTPSSSKIQTCSST